MQLRLKIEPASPRPQNWEHAGPVIRIGRAAQCELCLAEAQMVSSQHAQIELRDGAAWLSDRQSTNGTFLNDKRINGPVQLSAGDRIHLGNRGPELRVELVDAGAGPADKLVQRAAAGNVQAPSESRMSRWLVAAIALAALTPLVLIALLLIESNKEPAADNRAVADASATQPPKNDVPTQAAETVTPQPPVQPTSPPEPVKVATGNSRPADAAHAILKQNCYRCHGEQGSNEGGFNVVLDRDRLVSRQYVVPGKAADSPLLARVRDGEMPPEGEKQLSKEDVAALAAWIDAGAPGAESAAPREFVTTDDIFNSIAADLDGTGDRDRRFIRYFTLTHLYNSGAAEDELQTYRNALSKLVNSLSWKRQIMKPKPIDKAQTLLRIDLRDYDWSDAVWNSILAFYPYGIVYDTVTPQLCYRETQTEVPLVRADWFVNKASRPPLYERVLRIPSTDRELEKMLMVDAAQNVRQETVKRAGFNKSGVSQNNRLIERHESTYGAYWKSYDFAGNVGSQNLFQHPLGPASVLPALQRRGAFEHAGGELIFSLPNGLQGYMLVDAQGRRIDRGPTEIVSDPKQADRTVVNGISCMSCHYGGIIRKSDEIRQHVLQNRDAFAEANDVLALYAPKESMDALMEEDTKRFRQAVEQTGSTISENGEPVVNMARRYEEDIELTQAAAEVGLSPQQFCERLEKLPQMRRMLGPLTADGGTVKREVFGESFLDLARQLRIGRVSLRRAN